MPRKKGKKRNPPSGCEEVTHSEASSSLTVSGAPSDVPTGQLSRCNISEEAQPSHQVSTSSIEQVDKDKAKVYQDLGDNLFEYKRESSEEPVVSLLPRKPKIPGQKGREIKLISNCFPLKFPRGHVYHYDVVIIRKGPNYTTEDAGGATNIAPEKGIRKKYRCLNTKLNRKVFSCMQEIHFPDLFAVFDGEKNMYSMDDLTIETQNKYEIPVPAENQGDPNHHQGQLMDIFEVIIQPVFKKETGDCIISLEPLHALFKGTVTSVPQEAFMVLETVLRHSPCMRYVPVSRSFYYPPAPGEARPLGAGKEVWSGYHQSVRLGNSQAMVNLDISNTAFYESIPLIEYIGKFLNKSARQLHETSALKKEDIKSLNKDLRNLCVEVTHVPHYRRKYRIEKLSDKNAILSKFVRNVNGQNEEITVQAYFLQQYNIHLRYPHLPCLKTRGMKPISLPIEVCEIAEKQHSSRELNPRQQSEIIKVTARPPNEKFRQTLDVHKNSCYDTDAFLKKFEMEVLPEPIKVTGRTMETPVVLYKQNSREKRVRPENGSWNMRGIEFFTGTNIKAWTLLSFASPDDCPSGLLGEFAQSVCKFANRQGIGLGRCTHIEMAEPLLQGVRSSLRKTKENYQAEMIFIVLPIDSRSKRPGAMASKDLYSEVKRVAETSMGVVTQCVKGENVQRKGSDPSFISNLCLKLNAKMGGINNSMVPEQLSDYFREPILIIGVDVNHPSPAENIKHSLAAAVGSLDKHPSRYAVSVRAQMNEKKNRKTLEVILDMKSMVRELLMAFYCNTNKVKPRKIIVYRDGVSEGQFDDVQQREVKWIKEACTSVEPGYKPGITFVVVQKNHHVKFVPENPREGAGAMGNIPAGTTIDSKVTHPLNFDFYLYSHLAPKGTSRPCYYTVLEDENKFSFDALEKLTYGLCHTFVRCTKSISMPAPVRYAHLAAYRARRHLDSYLKELEIKEHSVPKRSQARDGGKEMYQVLPDEVLKKAIQVISTMANTMYFA